MALQSMSQAGGDGERDVRAAGDDPPDDGRRNQEARQMRSAGAVVLAGPARAASDSGACYYPRGLHFKTAHPAAFVFSLRDLQDLSPCARPLSWEAVGSLATRQELQRGAVVSHRWMESRQRVAREKNAEGKLICAEPVWQVEMDKMRYRTRLARDSSMVTTISRVFRGHVARRLLRYALRHKQVGVRACGVLLFLLILWRWCMVCPFVGVHASRYMRTHSAWSG